MPDLHHRAPGPVAAAVDVTDGIARLPGGALAGSTLTRDLALRRTVLLDAALRVRAVWVGGARA